MQAVLPRPDVAPLLREGFVALAADADDPEPDVHGLVFRLRNATTLPFVIVADADGGFVAGSAGAIDAERLKELLGKAAAGP